MSHNNSILDANNAYFIDGLTRQISYFDVNGVASKQALMQFDHNSERFTFNLPRYIESHDMLECNSVTIHYINVGSGGVGKKEGVYDVTDLRVNPENEDTLLFTWLVSQNVTEQPGLLSFLVRFACVAEDGTLDYVWNTAVFSNISVLEGIYNSAMVVEMYADVLEQLKAIVNALSVKSIVKTTKISLLSSDWVSDSDNQHSQIVDFADVTPYSKVDLQPTVEQLAIFYEKDITFVTENDNGVVTVYCIGQKPANDYVMQATITEVEK